MLDQLAPWLVPWAKALVGHFPMLTITSAYRSHTDQLRLWNNRHRNPYPVARPGTSWHQHRRAWDMTGPRADLLRAGATWKSWGGTWSTADVVHFQA